MLTIIEYRTRSHRIVAYDHDFGKVNWEEFLASPVAPLEPPLDDSFGKVDWEEFAKECVSLAALKQEAMKFVGQIALNAVEISERTAQEERERVAQEERERAAQEEREALERAAQEEREALERAAQKAWKKQLYGGVRQLTFNSLGVEKYRRVFLNSIPTPFVVTLPAIITTGAKYKIVGYTTKLLEKQFTKKDFHIEKMDLEMYNLFEHVEVLLEKFPTKLSISDSYYEKEKDYSDSYYYEGEDY
jgi:hypothetical protein